jgi:HB1, ASXL, restriction endonuclease HTH domain
MATKKGHKAKTDDAKKSRATKSARPQATPSEPRAKKLSALDGAARVLGETKAPMSCPELIEAMAAKGYWKSPGGKTPSATLYSALKREIASKQDESRFQQSGPGKFQLA